MAYLTEVVLADIFDKFGALTDPTVTEHGAIQFAKAETSAASWFTETMKAEARNRRGRALKLPALKPEVITPTTVESFNIPMNLSDTEKITVTFSTFFTGFQLFPYTFQDSAITPEEYIANKLIEIDEGMATAFGDLIISLLETNKSQVWTGEGNYGAASDYNFNTTPDELEVALNAQENGTVFSDLNAQFRDNLRGGTHRLLANPSIAAMINRMQKHGDSNDINLLNTLNGIPQTFIDDNLTNTDRWTAFMTKIGSLAIQQNFRQESIKKEATSDGWKWGVLPSALPKLGFAPETLTRTFSADNTGLSDSGGAVSMGEEIGFIFRVATVSSYNEDLSTRQADKLKITGKTS